MSGELELFLRGEDAHLHAVFAFDGGISRQDERCLREVSLAGEILHFDRGKTAGIREDCQGVALQWALREDIDLGDFEGAQSSGGDGF